MALAVRIEFADMVKETSSGAITAGGNVVLDGAVTGFESFTDTIGDSVLTYYSITDGTDWEVCCGYHVDVAGEKRLTQKELLASSTGAAVTWAAVTKTVRCINPASVIRESYSIPTSVQTTDATQTVLLVRGFTDNELGVPTNTTQVCHVKIVARQTAGTAGTVGDSYTGTLVVLAENSGGTVTLIGSPTTLTGSVYNSAALTVSVTATANDTDDTIQVKVTGEANKTIEWVGMVEFAEAV